MSQASPSDTLFISDKDFLQVLNSINLVAMTILLFDHALTFGDEVKYMWKCKITLFSVLFLANRYFAPVAMVCYVVGVLLPYNIQQHIYPKFFGSSFDGCNFLSVFTLFISQPELAFMILCAPTLAIAETILILRVYAVYQNNKIILSLLSSVFLVQLGLGGYIIRGAFTHGSHLLDLMRQSDVFDTIKLMLFLPPLVFDSLVAGFLTFGLYRRSKASISEMSLTNLIIRDGSLYFFVVFGSNLVWTIIGLIVHLKFKSYSLGFAPVYTMSSSITTTMIGRLTLNLRKYGADGTGTGEPSTNSTSLHFMRFRSQATEITITSVL
ncbi:hypothetical protein BDZ94DRAFT_1311847 [Collybia nuda]|uniref:DUF6533 domain-containing protein n=1 Tax=Collybia nuda TaxID=64659 RepID=A0A9P5Y0M7_9AGAR|nr:hypothetical protein BDZ94DRAFT_1311847 [Collybia nuda]